MSILYCPNCNSDLECQSGFSKYDEYYRCDECGAWLVNPDHNDSGERFPNMCWICDSCGELMNTQHGFSDWNSTWTCTNCGYENRISNDSEDSEDSYGAIGLAVIAGIYGVSKLVSHIKSKRENKKHSEISNNIETTILPDKKTSYSDDIKNDRIHSNEDGRHYIICEQCHDYSAISNLKQVNFCKCCGFEYIKCDKCGQVLNTGGNKPINFCPQCGHKLTTCDKCHAVLNVNNPKKVIYCRKCGNKIKKK